MLAKPAIYQFKHLVHYNDVIMGAMASQITSLTIVSSSVNSGADQRKHQSSASLAFVRGNRRGPVNFPHKWPVTRKIFPFDDVIMLWPFQLDWFGWKIALKFFSSMAQVRVWSVFACTSTKLFVKELNLKVPNGYINLNMPNDNLRGFLWKI